ncbi:unnamed protein product [Adineta steineri]|uniref:F-box domain-containing protein n=1 Tax=Adineta steineri TaxID=433720 RepID=A0A815IKD7_9BILA|nr:unnamed protein product [Adineta steineri]CAF1369572.1 unnamed protein product [Adineta steineri]CAF3701397.1 unnamed protein product [Adineta steineri]CAF4077611.1 unnamed protein product [Adineta steineri]
MTSKRIREGLQSIISRISPFTINTTTDDISGICWILDLPLEILQMITDYLNVRDLTSLSRSCQMFYKLINNDNFWIHRIHYQFPHPIANFYTFDLFQKSEEIELVPQSRPSGFMHTREDCDLDRFAVNSATYYNDEVIEQRHAKMYVSEDDFLTYIGYFHYNKPTKKMNVPLMKLVYFYLIDRKQQAAANMHVVHLNGQYLVDRTTQESLTGHVIQLQSVCWLEITGNFEHHIMPGKYEVIWRMKGHAGNISMYGVTEFLVAPSNGKMLIKRITEEEFRSYTLEHGNRWFLKSLGQIMIYKPSKVMVGIRNWREGSWKAGVTWDYIELKVIS